MRFHNNEYPPQTTTFHAFTTKIKFLRTVDIYSSNAFSVEQL